jgi:hypothetical protein
MIFENVLSLLNIHNHCRFRAILVTTAVVPEYRVLVPSRYFLENLIFENNILSKVLFFSEQYSTVSTFSNAHNFVKNLV